MDLNKMPYIYWPDTTIMDYVQRRIIVHSIIYYEYNESVISDYDFDMLCQEFLRLKEEIQKPQLQLTKYWYCFHDFDGSTGFHLMKRLNQNDFEYLTNLAGHVLESYKREIKGETNDKKKRTKK